MLRWIKIISVLIFFSCSTEEEVAGPIHPDVLPEVRFIKLVPDDYSNQETMVANGKSTVKFTMEQYDKDKKLLFKNIPYRVKVLVNGKDPLVNPFVFSTSVPGEYSFEPEGFPSKAILGGPVKIRALADKEFAEFTVPVILHYLALPGANLNEEYLRRLTAMHISHLNLAYRNQYNSKDPNSVDVFINFEAARNDPDGNPLSTPGLSVVRSDKIKFKNSDDESLHRLIWDGNFWSPKNYLNVWVCDFEENYSWARFPFLGPSNSEFPTNAFGVFFNAKQFAYERGISILIHEIGHMLNLYHNFNSACSGDLDQCTDTRDYQRDFDKDYNGGLSRTSCDDIGFPGTNYMDYFPNEYNTFTYEQRERMRRTINLCPFLPTPLNQSSRRFSSRSSLKMNWNVDKASLIY